ncbi:hypothetical protein [Flavobacterium sp. GT3P67]|uniref:hypothetical protein n=1 Tax=Flavobacterium sp. GT3P67 TaxID=2541722 RepID=UPI0010447EF6|nr:hypothetical protein [Flavobacterium sp. GT3P67]TDE52728.1 hypothetical protein E0H99_11435 [Flavobacterium sp. GT3P67]
MKYLKILLFILLFIGAVAIGYFIKSYPIIEFDRKLKIYEVFNLILTATIGLSIPFFIKRWIEDSRHVKNNLINELKDTLSEIIIVKSKIKHCFNENAISQRDKQQIIVQFEETDLKLNCLDEQFKESYNNETKKIREEIKTEYFNYWRFATGAEIMSENFNTVSENYYRSHNEVFNKLETKIKQAINKVHRI